MSITPVLLPANDREFDPSNEIHMNEVKAFATAHFERFEKQFKAENPGR